jgi:histone acetyltransferase 1
MASGSMKEYLSITYREKINSTATPADDIEGILYKFIPSGELSRIIEIERHM